MTTLEYYEDYQVLALKINSLDGKIRFSKDENRKNQYLLLQNDLLERCRMKEYQFSHYLSWRLSDVSYYRAFQELQFLFYRCMKGMTMKQTAENMAVSRDTAYRIKNRLNSFPFTPIE